MSAENVDLIKRHIGDVDLAHVIRDDDAWNARMSEVRSGFAEDFEFVAYFPGKPVRGAGFAEFRTQFLEWIEPWETYEPGIEEIIDLDVRAVVLGIDRGTMRGMDRPVEGPRGLVLYTFDRGKVIRVEYYLDRGEGMRAAGIDRPGQVG
jgi:hypothetical protein